MRVWVKDSTHMWCYWPLILDLWEWLRRYCVHGELSLGLFAILPFSRVRVSSRLTCSHINWNIFVIMTEDEVMTPIHYIGVWIMNGCFIATVFAMYCSSLFPFVYHHMTTKTLWIEEVTFVILKFSHKSLETDLHRLPWLCATTPVIWVVLLCFLCMWL